jgi:hypothetical protein
LVLSRPRQRQSASTTAARTTPQSPPGSQREGARAAVPTRATPAGTRATGQPSRRRECPCTRGLYGGDGHTGASDPGSPTDGSPVDPQRTRLAPAIGGGAAPVWCHPRRRDAAARNPRASSEAGTRRTPVRWDPTHGEQQDQPSFWTGSASSDDQLGRDEDANVKNCRRGLDIGSHSNARFQPPLDAGATQERTL